MKTNRLKWFVLVLMLLSITGISNSQIAFKNPNKKLIDFSQHTPVLQDFKQRFGEYERGIFDGVSVKLSLAVGSGNVFMVDNWAQVSQEAKDAEMKLAASLPVSKMIGDNFLALFGASQMDWFSDEDWAKAEDYIRFAARVAKAAHFKGILWDAEPYKPGKNPWRLDDQEGVKEHSFEAYYQQIRKRGSQFIKALQEEFPGIVIFSLRELSDFQIGSPFSHPLFPVMKAEDAIQGMKEAWWGMHIPFNIGIIDGIAPGVTFIDGNEEAYFYTSPLEFYAVRNTLVDDAKALIPPELRSKHHCMFRLGHAIAPEYITGNWLGMKPFPMKLTGQGLMMTPEERCLWLEHNTYYALRASDEYAWTWTEGINWWTGEELPSGYKEAVLRAKEKVAQGKPLGFDIGELIKRSQDKAEEYYKSEK